MEKCLKIYLTMNEMKERSLIEISNPGTKKTTFWITFDSWYIKSYILYRYIVGRRWTPTFECAS